MVILIRFYLLLHVANAPESYNNEDLKAELELLKTLKPHPHVIRLLGCVTESGKSTFFFQFSNMISSLRGLDFKFVTLT